MPDRVGGPGGAGVAAHLGCSSSSSSSIRCCRIFYDAVTDEAGHAHAGELPASSSPTASTCARWGTRSCSGVVTVVCVLGAGHRHRACCWCASTSRAATSSATSRMIPIISPPLVGVLGFTVHPGPGGHGERAPDGLSSTCSSRSTSSTASTASCWWRRCHLLPDDHAQRGGRARQDRPVAGGGGRERGRARLDQFCARSRCR